MATFEEIKRANDSIRTTNIQGKEYAEVNQRIKAFRMVYPDGFVQTHLESLQDGVCVMTAAVGYYTENGDAIVIATGTAYEKEGSSFINKTSYIENCETSAIGRALGVAGFGIDTSVASAEEVQNAMLNQNKVSTIGPDKVAALSMLIDETGTDTVKICEAYKVNSLPELTEAKWLEVMRILTKRKEKADAERSGQ